MGKLLDQGLFSELSLGQKRTVRAVDLIAAILLTAFALYARIALFNYESSDYTQFLLPWYDALKEAGGFSGLALSLGDYTPPYLCFLAALTYLPVSPLVGIKVFSCIFDFLLAIYAAKIVYEKYRTAPAALLTYGITLFLPTVLLNSAFWGQCDSLFTAFLLMCLYYLQKKKPWAALICFAVSFAFKLQAVFFIPLLCYGFLQRRIHIRHFLAVPAVYLFSILPAWLAGRPFGELLLIYVRQTGTYSSLSLNAPNLYSVIADDRTAGISMAAILLTLAALLVSMYFLYRMRVQLTKERLVLTALFFVILLPYLLPRMHERYFFIADVLALVYAFYRPKRFYLPVLVVVASMAGYLPFLFGSYAIDINFAALLMGLSLGLVGYDLFRPAYSEYEAKQFAAGAGAKRQAEKHVGQNEQAEPPKKE